MKNSPKQTFLAVHDYGMGGVWLLIDAESVSRVRAKFPKLIVYEDRPSWMTTAMKEEYVADCEHNWYHWDVDAQPTGWLRELWLSNHPIIPK